MNGTSTSSPYYWHTNLYCNWGEPGRRVPREHAGKPIQNQALFDRNFVPNMLGVPSDGDDEPGRDGVDAGARGGLRRGLRDVDALEALRQNPDTPRLLDTIREWEAARRSGAFTPSQRERARNPRLEFHLEPAPARLAALPVPRRWAVPAHSDGATAWRTGPARWAVENTDAGQPLQFRIQVVRRRIHLHDPPRGRTAQSLDLAVTLAAGESLVFDASGLARSYDAKGRQKGVIKLDRPVPQLRAADRTCRSNARSPARPAWM